MAKTILIAGKDMPAGSKFSDGFINSSRRVVITGPDSEISENAQNPSSVQKSDEHHLKMVGKASGIATVGWNKASPLSSRTLILNVEAVFEELDEAVLYFDEDFYSARANRLGIEECSRGVDQMILSYQFLAMEILNRFEQKKSANDTGTLVFLFKEGCSASDALKNPAMRNGAYSIASPVVAAAAGAFEKFAENIAALYGDSSFLNILLIHCDRQNEFAGDDVALAKWLSSYVDNFRDEKNKMNAKKSVQWVKAGSKFTASAGFSLFSKGRK